MNNTTDKSLESWIWDAACSIRGAQEAPKFKDFILPLIFTKRLCDVFDDELNRIAQEVGSRAKAFKLAEKDHKLVPFYLPLKPQDPQREAARPQRRRSRYNRSQLRVPRKFAEGSCQSAGEYFTPPEVARIMARIMDPEPGMSVYDPCCGSASPAHRLASTCWMTR